MRHSISFGLSVFWVVAAVFAPQAQAQGYRGGRSWAFTGISPTKGPWGTLVTLRGYGFGPKITVSYQGKPVKPLSVGRRAIRVRVPQGAGSGWFEVAYQGRSLRAPSRFLVVNPPRLASLVPNASPAGSWVELHGRFLRPKMRFWVGRMPVKKRFVNDQMVMLFIHDGLKSGRVSYRWKGQRFRTKLRFQVRALPRIRDFSPKSGWTGTKVVIQGRDFCSAPRVHFGERAARVLSRNPNRLVVLVPSGVVTGSLSVDCFGKRTIAGTFEVSVPYAAVTAVEPPRGGTGRWVEIRGSGFTSKDRFWLGAVALRRTKYLSSSRYRLFVPKGSVSGKIQFESHGKRFVSNVVYDVLQPPVIRRVRPLSGWYGDRITVQGRHLCGDARVFIGGKEARIISRSPAGTRLAVEVVDGTRGGRIMVRCGAFRGRFRKPFKLVAPVGSVSRLRPAFASPGSTVTVFGRGFLPRDRFFLGRIALPGRYRGPGRFEVTVPKGAKSGFISYQHLGKRVRTKVRLEVGWPRPIVAGYKPSTAWYGQEVEITGRRICSAPRVFLGKRAVEVLSATGDRIRVRLPDGVSTGNFIVTCPGHRVIVRPKIRIKPPFAQVYSIFPKAGPWGTWVTVNGDNFSRRDRFFLGDRPLSRKYLAPHQVQVLVVDGAETGELIVQSGGHRVKTGKRFKVLFPIPFVRGFEPVSGWYGQEVRLRGESFCLHPKVFFGSRQAGWVKRVSHTEIRTRVPRGTSTAKVSVVCYGEKRGRSRRMFIVSPPIARVTSVNPDRGGWNRWILVKGHNFTRQTRFYLGRLRLKADYRSAETVRLFIPPGAKTGLIYVESYGKRRDSTFSYVVRRAKPRKPARRKRHR